MHLRFYVYSSTLLTSALLLTRKKQKLNCTNRKCCYKWNQTMQSEVFLATDKLHVLCMSGLYGSTCMVFKALCITWLKCSRRPAGKLHCLFTYLIGLQYSEGSLSATWLPLIDWDCNSDWGLITVFSYCTGLCPFLKGNVQDYTRRRAFLTFSNQHGREMTSIQ